MTAFLRRFYAGGGASTTLASAMGNSDTSFSISATTGWPGGSPGANFIVVIDRGTSSEEKILCSSNSGTVVSVASSGRGYDGTSATSHNSNATVSLCGGAIDFDETNQISHLLGNGAEGSLLYGKGTGVLPTALAIGTNGYYLTSNGTDPGWTALPTIPPVSAVVQETTLTTAMTASAATVSTLNSLAAGTYLISSTVNFLANASLGTPVNVATYVTGGASQNATAWGVFPASGAGVTPVLAVTAVDIIILSTTTTLTLNALCPTGSGLTALSSQGQTFLAVRFA